MTDLAPGYCPTTCPRCGMAFACGAGADRAAPCPCTSVDLGDARLAELRSRYDGCLCPACLHLLAAQPDTPA